MSRVVFLRRLVIVLALVALCGLGAPASAQYFGQNKVHYRSFDFQILRTDHFDIYFYPSERAGIDIAARMAERWRVRLERLLKHELRGRQPLVLYGSHTDFEQTNVIGGQLGEGTGGVTESLKRRIVLPLGGPLADTDHVIGHELVHAFQFDMTTGPESRPGETGAHRLPLWFIEGMAEYLSIGPVDPNTAMWVRDAARQEKLPRIKDLNNPKYFPYRWGQAVWAYIAGRFGEQVIGELLTTAAADGDVDGAFESVLGVKTEDLSNEWHAAIQRTYGTVFEDASRPDQIGRLVITGKGLGEELNVGPSISPDGKWIAFLSTQKPLLDGPVPRGRCHRPDRAKADEHGDRSARLEHSVHLLGRRLGQRQPADCRCHGCVGAGGSRDLRCAVRFADSRDSGDRRRRDPEPDVVAGWQGHRLYRHAARPHRSLHPRPVGWNAPSSDQRCVR